MAGHRSLIVPPIPAERAGVGNRAQGYDENVLVDLVAVLVLVLMAADVFRMLFVDTSPSATRSAADDS